MENLKLKRILPIVAGLILAAGCAENQPPPAAAPQAAVEGIETAPLPEPPPAQIEIVPSSPGPDFVWVKGRYEWKEQWIWVSGRWMIPPRLNAFWVVGHWEHHGGGTVWIPGHWR